MLESVFLTYVAITVGVWQLCSYGGAAHKTENNDTVQSQQHPR